MKIHLWIIPAIMLVFGCHDYKADADKLQSEKEAMAQEANYKDSSIKSFISQFNEIENNLTLIEKKQASISANSKSSELKGAQVDRINENIREINALVIENKEKIIALNKKLKGSNIRLVEFEKMVSNLNQQLGEKDKQLNDLNVELATMNSKVEKLNTDVITLTAESSIKQQMIDEQVSQLHTAYYATGTYKELESKKVVDKKGGFLGLGKDKVLKNDFDASAFNTIDITQTSTIPIEAKNAMLLTNHPSGSYSIEHSGDHVSNLQITDPEKFWKASKYLVVVVDK